MQKNTVKSAASALAAIFALSGCSGSGDSRGSDTELPELEAHGKTLQFYDSSDNSQYAYVVEDGTILNLQDPDLEYDEDLSAMIMEDGEVGKFYTWIDDKGDDNASNDVEKIMMMDAGYSYATDGNATWNDFYYLQHLNSEAHMHPHSNDEFNVTEGGKFIMMQRFNKNLAEHYAKTQEIETKLAEKGAELCGWHKLEADFGTFYFVAGIDGKMYVYGENLDFKDEYTMDGVTSCEADRHGFTSSADGVLFFSAESQKIHLVDSHDNGAVWHEHTTFDLSEILGAGKTATTMTGIGEIEEHDHDEE
ncbi:MAG: hypothetical protein PHO65_04890 [Sulfurovum sp.]|nr:hypothetical protein [Sulfurovum sp.]